MKKKTPSTRDESQRSAKVNGKTAAGAKTPKGRQKKGGDGKQTEAQRTRRHRMQVIHCELAQRYDNPNPAAPPINCPTLAEKLEVSRYTIERDIAYMRDMEKLPIDFDTSRNTEALESASKPETGDRRAEPSGPIAYGSFAVRRRRFTDIGP